MSDKSGDYTQRSKAIITGASSGIGEAIAMQLAADGAHVLLVARSAETLEQVAAKIRALGGKASCLAVDLAQREAAAAVVEAAVAAMGGIDLLVNCASLTHNADFFDLTDDHWEDAFAVKLFAAIRLCRLAWPALKEGRGSIINIGGIGARPPSPFTAITAASSSALLAVTKLLAQSGIADGVQVNAINPGLIRTPRIERTIGGGGSTAEIDEALAASVRRSGVVRHGTPQDVAALVAYIVSPAGSLLQGSIIDIDGGATKGM